MTTGERIKQLRIQKGLSQEELAAMLNTTRQAIFKYEAGIVTNIPMNKIYRMCDIFSTDPIDLLRLNEQPNTVQRVLTREQDALISAYHAVPQVIQDAIWRILGAQRVVDERKE